MTGRRPSTTPSSSIAWHDLSAGARLARHARPRRARDRAVAARPGPRRCDDRRPRAAPLALVGVAGVGAPARRRIARRSLLIALVALLAIVVAAAAIGLGVPGIRIEVRSEREPARQREPAPWPRARPPGHQQRSLRHLRGARPGGASHAARPGVGPDREPRRGPRRTQDLGCSSRRATGYADPSEIHLTGVQPFSRVTLKYVPIGPCSPSSSASSSRTHSRRSSGGDDRSRPSRSAPRRLVDRRSAASAPPDVP